MTKLKYSVIITIFSIVPFYNASAQNKIQELESIEKADESYSVGLEKDWLVSKSELKARVFRNEKANELILSNGIISRTFRIAPNAATTSLKILANQQEFVRKHGLCHQTRCIRFLKPSNDAPVWYLTPTLSIIMAHETIQPPTTVSMLGISLMPKIGR